MELHLDRHPGALSTLNHLQEERDAFEESLQRKRRECEERTQKNAEKRRRKKQKKMKAKGQKGGAGSSGAAEDGESGDEEGDGSGDVELKGVQGEDIYAVVQIKDDGSFLEMASRLVEAQKEEGATEANT
jgi:hypothetical protein